MAGEGSGFQYWGIYIASSFVAPHIVGLGTQFEGNQTGAVSNNSPASYQQTWGFMDLTGGQQIHKFYASKAQWQFGDGGFYLDFNKDLAGAVAMVFDANTFIRNVRGSNKILLVASGGSGEIDTTNAPILRTAKIRSQDVSGFNVDPEAGWDAKTPNLKVTSGLRLSFATASRPLKVSSLDDVVSALIDVNSASDIAATGFSNGDFAKWNGSAFVPGSAGTTLPVADSTSIVKDDSDGTKQLQLELDALTTATTRVWTVPDRDQTVGKTSYLTATASSLPQTVSNTEGDVSGATVTLNLDGDWEVTACVDLNGDNGTGLVTIKLMYNGIDQTDFQINGLVTSAAGTFRGSYAGHWIISNTGSKVAKLRSIKSGASSTANINAARITAKFLG